LEVTVAEETKLDEFETSQQTNEQIANLEKESDDEFVYNITATEEPSSCSKILSVRVPLDSIKREEDSVYKQLAEQAFVPGFRIGHVPEKILKARFGKHIHEESVQNAKINCLKKIFYEPRMPIVGEPSVREFKEDPETGITFELYYEYIPEFELIDYSNIKIKGATYQVTEKEVAKALENLREMSATSKEVDVPAADGNIVYCKIDATIDNEPFLESISNRYPITLGKGAYLPGMEDNLKGKKAKDFVEFDSKIPDEYHLRDKRGKTAHFMVEVLEVREKILPEINDAFAQTVGNYKTITELKDAIREELLAQTDEKIREENIQKLLDYLVEKHKFDVPGRLIESKFQMFQKLMERDLMRKGVSLESLGGEEREKLAESNREEAEKKVRESIILYKISEKENIKVDDDDLELYLRKYAKQLGYDEDAFVKYVIKEELEDYYKERCTEEKVINLLMEQVKIK